MRSGDLTRPSLVPSCLRVYDPRSGRAPPKRDAIAGDETEPPDLKSRRTMTILTNPPQHGEPPHAGMSRAMRLKSRATGMRGSTKPLGEEQAGLERGDPEYAEIGEAVRQSKDKGEQPSLSADKTKVECDRSGCFLRLSRCSDRRDTDAVVEGKGVAEVCLAQLGRQLCGRHQRRACPRAMRSAVSPRIARELAN